MCFLHCTFIYLLLRSPGRPTAANDGQRRPTKTKKGHKSQPRVVRHHVSRLQHTHHTFGPDDAQEGQPRPTKRKKGSKVPKVRVFFIVHLFIYYYEAREGPQQPTTANAGPRRREMAARSVYCSAPKQRDVLILS